MWIDALRAKFENKGTPFGTEEWDRLLGHCMAVTDIPCWLFSEELIATYPLAKVILTHRNVDAWYESTLRSIVHLHAEPWHYWLSFFDRELYTFRVGRALAFHHAYDGDIVHNARSVFAQHYAKIRRLVPKDRLLEYHVTDGWYDSQSCWPGLEGKS